MSAVAVSLLVQFRQYRHGYQCEAGEYQPERECDGVSAAAMLASPAMRQVFGIWPVGGFMLLFFLL
jgi:hypothetical protein